MELIRGNNTRDCLGAAVAMVTNTSLQEVVDFCGHDGSVDGFDILDATEYALNRGFAILSYYGQSAYTESDKATPINFAKIIPGRTGIIGYRKASGACHAVATDGRTVFDPRGSVTSLEFFLSCQDILVFWRIEKVCTCNNQRSRV